MYVQTLFAVFSHYRLIQKSRVPRLKNLVLFHKRTRHEWQMLTAISADEVRVFWVSKAERRHAQYATAASTGIHDSWYATYNSRRLRDLVTWCVRERALAIHPHRQTSACADIRGAYGAYAPHVRNIFVPGACHQMSHLRLKCIKFDFRSGSAPDLAGGAYTLTPPSCI